MVEWKELGSISEIGTGSNNREDSSENGLYPFFVRSKDILKIDNYLFDEEAILIPGEGGIGDIFHYINGKYGLHQRTYRVHPNSSSINGKYLYYYLFENFKTYINKKSFKSTATSIRKPMLTEFPVAIPPLSEQNRIVGILDIFTSSINNLDKQIELRQKQYEYYRNKLLSFEEGDEGVEWKPIGEIGKLVRGNGLQKTDFTEKGVGCIHYGQIYTRLGLSCDKTLSFVSQELASKLTVVEPGNLVIACTSENVEDVCKSVVWLGSENVVTGGHACVFKHQEEPKYIGYCFLTNNFFIQKRKYAYGAKVIDIKTEKLALIKLPIPPLEKQLSIVRTLDTFESLLTNLKKERELRQKQYEYYREKLLTFA